MTEWERSKRGAKKFAREVELGKTYYIIMTSTNPWGDEPVWTSYVFDHRQVFTGGAMSGSMSAEGLCLNYGPVYDEKPGSHIRPMCERDDDQLYATPADIVQVRKSRDKKPARR
ncbi:hypothetical protein [Streptomyces yunnanensis]|uniref:Uncharacterized protein n=1 Tax=Streptomyces yunnanensis TaxID=156453 RepID=A0A9X8MT84_9ACTN|nr:hypothetical protein [Streptomyces yunnanensis]SHL74765.1 hypothetical protein SAMN05216268_10661 [Streptomyces yunnanensis]